MFRKCIAINRSQWSLVGVRRIPVDLPVNRRWCSTNVNIFDRVAKQMHKERAASSPDVQLFDYIRAEIGERMVDRMFDLTRPLNTIAEIGCNRGFITCHELPEGVEQIYLCDSSATMLKQAQARSKAGAHKVSLVQLDEETPKFEENSLDMIVSNLSLHWVNDLPGCFGGIFRSLKPDGVFIASMFASDTLFELRSSLQLAETERKGGISAHISPFTAASDIGSLLQQAGFKLLTIDTDELVIGYPSMIELMYDLKGMAENNATYIRPLHLSRDVLNAATVIYKEMYGNDDGIPATFNLIHLVGWKPGPNQPKPLERGSANASFKDLDKIVNKQ